MFMMFMVSVFYYFFRATFQKSALAKHENQHPESRPFVLAAYTWLCEEVPAVLALSRGNSIDVRNLSTCESNMWKQTCVIHVCHRLESNKPQSNTSLWHYLLKTHLGDVPPSPVPSSFALRWALLACVAPAFQCAASSLVGEFQVLVTIPIGSMVLVYIYIC